MSLIDREKLLEKIKWEHCGSCILDSIDKGVCCESCNYGFLLKAVKEAPTVDAVEVVRCFECKHLNHCVIKPTLPHADNMNHFCAWGEKEGDLGG